MKTFQIGEVYDGPFGKYGSGIVVDEQGKQVGFWDLNPEAAMFAWMMEEDRLIEEEMLRMEHLEREGEIKMAQLDDVIDFELAEDSPPEWWVLETDLYAEEEHRSLGSEVAAW